MSVGRPLPAHLYGYSWWLRPGTSDKTSVDEVVGKDSYFTKEFKPGSRDRWLDAGANIGAFSVIVGTVAAGVDAYEPHPANAELALRNIRANRARARVHAMAVAETAGVATLGLASTDYAQWRHSLLLSDDNGGIEVPVAAFADAVAGCDCAKLDIEGSEIELLQTADLSCLRKLVFEWHFDRERDTNVYLGVVERLHDVFARVSYRHVPPDTQYNWFPPAAVVRCW